MNNPVCRQPRAIGIDIPITTYIARGGFAGTGWFSARNPVDPRSFRGPAVDENYRQVDCLRKVGGATDLRPDPNQTLIAILRWLTSGIAIQEMAVLIVTSEETIRKALQCWWHKNL